MFFFEHYVRASTTLESLLSAVQKILSPSTLYSILNLLIVNQYKKRNYFSQAKSIILLDAIIITNDLIHHLLFLFYLHHFHHKKNFCKNLVDMDSHLHPSVFDLEFLLDQHHIPLAYSNHLI